jgi:hypothetical protein
MKQLLLIRSVPPGRNQWMLLLSAATWGAVVGLEPLAWPPWVALGLAWPWFLWQLPGAAAVRLVAFPSAMAFHMATSPPPDTLDLVSVLFLFVAYIGFSLSRPPAPAVDFRPVPPRGELRGLVPVAFLAWAGGLVALMLLLDGHVPWVMVTAVFCAAHYGAWRRLAQVGRPVREPLVTIAAGTALLLAIPAARQWAGTAVAAGVTIALAVWIAGVSSLKTR